jgi:hypothetical protein
MGPHSNIMRANITEASVQGATGVLLNEDLHVSDCVKKILVNENES